MGLIGPLCVFSGVGEKESGGGSWQGEYRSRQSETSARIHLLDWLVTGAAGSPPPPSHTTPPTPCRDVLITWPLGEGGQGGRSEQISSFKPKCAVTVGPNCTSHLFNMEELEACMYVSSEASLRWPAVWQTVNNSG